MTATPPSGSFRHETFLALTRGLLTGLTAMTLWGLSFMLIPGVDKRPDLLNRFSARQDSLQQLQEGALAVTEEYVRILPHLQHRRFDSTKVGRGRDTLPVYDWLEIGQPVNVPSEFSELVDRLAMQAAQDSLSMALASLRASSAIDSEVGRVAQVELGEERRLWMLVNDAMTARSASSRRKDLVKEIHHARSNLDILYDGAHMLLKATDLKVRARSQRMRALGDSLVADGRKENWRSLFALLAVLVGALSIITVAAYSLTGKWETLPRFLRKRLEPDTTFSDTERDPFAAPLGLCIGGIGVLLALDIPHHYEVAGALAVLALILVLLSIRRERRRGISRE